MILKDKIEELERENELLNLKINVFSKQHEDKIALFSLIHEIGLTLMHIKNFKLACRTILDVIINNTKAQNCSIMLLDFDQNQLFLIAAIDSEKQTYLIDAKDVLSKEGVHYCLRPGEGAAGRAVHEKKTILVHDTSESSVYSSETENRVKINSLLALPLIVENRTIGVLNLSHSEKNAFEEKDIDIFNILGNFIALSIHSSLNQEKIKYFEQKYQALVNQSPNAIVIIQDSLHKFANPKYVEITGYTLKELGKFPFEKFVYPDYCQEVNHHLYALLNKIHSNKSFTTWLTNKAGDKIEMEINASSFIYYGKPAVMISARDLSIYRELENKQKRSETVLAMITKRGYDIHRTLENKNLHSKRALKKSQGFAKNLIDCSLNMIIATDKNNNITEFNRAAQDKFGYSLEDVTGQKIEVLYNNPFEFSKVQKIIGETGKFTGEIAQKRKNGEAFLAYLSASLLCDSDDKIVGFMGVLLDITDQKEAEKVIEKANEELEERVKERTTNLVILNKQLQFQILERKRVEEKIKASLKEKELLLLEIHHRVKNNLQIISSLLDLQADSIEDFKTLQMFKDCQNRIQAMALIHENLYHSKEMLEIDYKEYLVNLVDYLIQSYGANSDKITRTIDVFNVSFGMNIAIPVGLIINELVSNSLKYAFPEERTNRDGVLKNEIKISLRSIHANAIELVISDNGISIPSYLNFRDTKSLGLQLVVLLVESQLQGKIDHDTTDGGTKFKIRFNSKPR